MNLWKRFAATLACIAIVQVSFADFAVAGDTRWHPVSVESYVKRLGVGAEVQVDLSSGERIRGPIADINEGSFLVDLGDDESFQVMYTRVRDIALTRLDFKQEEPDPVAVRRVVATLGVDTHVMVRTTAGDELRGDIRVVDAESFQLQLDDERRLTPIRYDDVVQIGKNLSAGATIAIVVGVVVAAAVIVVLATGDDLADVLD